MIGEVPNINNAIPKSLSSPPQRPLDETRALVSVFTGPVNPLINPDDAPKKSVMPTVPGAPVTTGMMQVVYDGQPQWDRSACNTGPVRRFFRSWINNQSDVRQP